MDIITQCLYSSNDFDGHTWAETRRRNINNCLTRCNTKQSLYYSASSFYMFRVSTTLIIRSTQNCNYSLRYCAATSLQRGQAIYINNCPTRCNTQQSIYYSANSLYMFRVSTTPIIRSTQNCNYSLRYWSYFFCSYLAPT